MKNGWNWIKNKKNILLILQKMPVSFFWIKILVAEEKLLNAYLRIDDLGWPLIVFFLNKSKNFLSKTIFKQLFQNKSSILKNS